MKNLLGIFAVVGVLSVFACITLWAADWIENYDESGRSE
jgi:hypothetical protein